MLFLELLYQAIERPDLMDQAVVHTPSPISLEEPILSAVLVLLHKHDIVLTQRSIHLSVHAGQICCPGGRYEMEKDDSMWDTATRECSEELGLPVNMLDPVAALPYFDTRTGYRIYPFLAELRVDDPPFVINPDEVSQVIRLPLKYVLDIHAYHWHTLHLESKKNLEFSHGFWRINYPEAHIWGATAAVLRRLAWLVNDVRVSREKN